MRRRQLAAVMAAAMLLTHIGPAYTFGAEAGGGEQMPVLSWEDPEEIPVREGEDELLAEEEASGILTDETVPAEADQASEAALQETGDGALEISPADLIEDLSAEDVEDLTEGSDPALTEPDSAFPEEGDELQEKVPFADNEEPSAFADGEDPAAPVEDEESAAFADDEEPVAEEALTEADEEVLEEEAAESAAEAFEEIGDVIHFADEYHAIYSEDGPREFHIDMGQLEGEDYTLELDVGTWEGGDGWDPDRWIDMFPEGEGWTLDGSTFTLDGSYFYEHGAAPYGLHIRARASVGINTYVDWCYFNVYETERDYHFDWGDRTMLKGWEQPIRRWYDVWLNTYDHPFENFEGLEVLDVFAENEDPEQTRPVLFCERREWTNDEGEEDHDWNLRAVSDGPAIVTVTFLDEYGNEQQDQFRVWVGNDVYELYLNTESGADTFLPGSEIILNTDLYHHVQDMEDADISGVVYKWTVPEESADCVTELEPLENGSSARLVFRDLNEDEGEYGVRIEVRAYEGEMYDENGDPVYEENGDPALCEQAYADIWLTVRGQYVELRPIGINTDINVGETIEVRPEVLQFTSQDGNSFDVLSNVHWRWEYDENQLSVADEEGNRVGNYADEEGEPYNDSEASYGEGKSFFVTRTWKDDTGLTLIADFEYPDGTEDSIRRDYHFGWRNYDIWFENGDNQDIFGAGSRAFRINTDNLNGMAFELAAEVGTWNHEAPEGEDPWVQRLDEGDGWELNGNELTLDGDRLFELTGGEEGVNVHVTASLDGLEISDAWCWVNVREPVAEYDFPGDRSMLVGWEERVDGWINCHVENNDYPDGGDFGVRVWDVSVRNEDPDLDYNVLDIQKDELTNDEGEDDWNWRIEALEYGCGLVTITYETAGGEIETYEYRLWVGGDVYDLSVRTADGANIYLPETVVDLEAEVWHHVEGMDDNDVDLSGITYEWTVSDWAADHVSVTWQDGSNHAQIQFREMTPEEAQDGLWQDVCIEVRAYEGILRDENGNPELDENGEEQPCEVAYADIRLNLSNWYYDIYPTEIDRNLHMGQPLTGFVPEVRLYTWDSDSQDGYVVVDDVHWRWEYDENHLSVLDEDGNQVGNYHEAGQNENGDDIMEYNDSEASYGSGRSFDICRNSGDDTGLTLIADVYREYDGGTDELRRDYSFRNMNYDLWFECDNGENIYNDGSRTFTLYLDQLEGVDYELAVDAGTWNHEAGEEEDPWIDRIDEGDGWTLEGNEMTLDGGKLFDLVGADGEISVLVRALVNGTEVNRTQRWFNIRETFVDYHFFSGRNMMTGWEEHIDGWMGAYVENSEYPEGADIDVRVTDVSVCNEDPGQALQVLKLRKNVRVNDEGEPDWSWDIEARNYGTGIVTYTYEDIYGDEQTAEYYLWVGDEVYDLSVRTEDGADKYLPGSTVNLEAEVHHMMEGVNDDEVDLSGITYEWKVSEGSESDISLVSQEGNTAQLVFRDMTEEEEEGLWKDVWVEVRAYEGVLLDENGDPQLDENGNEQLIERAYTDIRLVLSNDYRVIVPYELDSGLSFGQAITDLIPEVREYSAGNPDEYTVLDNIHWRWEYEDSQLAVTDEDGLQIGNYTMTGEDENGDEIWEYNDSEASHGSGRAFTVTRTGTDGTDLRLIAEIDYGHGRYEEEQVNYWFDGCGYDIWFDDGDFQRIYSDGSRTFRVNLDDLEGLDYDLNIMVGTWNHEAGEDENPWKELFDEGNGWSWNGDELTLDGEKLYELAGEEGGINVSIIPAVNGRDLCYAWCWFEIREARAEYDFPEDRALLRGWTDHIDGWMHCYVEDSEHPDGEDFDVRMLDVSVRNEDEDPDLDDVLSFWKNEWTNDEGEEEWKWDIRAENHGCGIVTYTYLDVNGEEQTGEYRLYVGEDVYDLGVRTADGACKYLPETVVDLEAEVWHHVQDMDDNDVDLSGITFKWEIPEEFAEDVWFESIDGNKAAVRFRAETDEDREEGLWRDVRIEVRAYEGELYDEEGNPVLDENGEPELCERVYADIWLTLSNRYYEIWPYEMDEDLLIGHSIEDLKPQLRVYSSDNPDEYEVMQNVHWRWEYDSNNLFVRDKDGVVVGNYFDNGEDEEGEPIVEYCDSEGSYGSDAAFTITRTWRDGTQFRLIAEAEDEYGDRTEEDREYWFHGPDYNIWFEDGDYKRVFTGQPQKFQVNMEELDGIDYRVQIEAGDWNGDEERWNETWEEGWSFDEETHEFTVDAQALQDAGRDHMNVRLAVYVNYPEDMIDHVGERAEEELNDTWCYFDLQDSDWYNFPIDSENLFPNEERFLAEDDGGRIQGRDSFFPNDDWVRFRVKSVNLVSDPDEQDSRDAVAVERVDDGWVFRAVRPGRADATAVFELFADDQLDENGQITASSVPAEEIEYTWEFWVGDFRANIGLIGKDGTDQMMAGSEFTITSVIVAEAYDWNGDYQHDVDTSHFFLKYEDVWIEHIDEDGWDWARTENKDEIVLTNEDGSVQAKITWKQIDGDLVLTSDREVPDLEIRTHAIAYDYSDEDPEDVWDIAHSEFSVWVQKRLYKIVLAEDWDKDFLPGMEQTVEPTLLFLKNPDDPGTPVDDPTLFYRWSWYETDGSNPDDPSHVIITDSEGNILTQFGDHTDTGTGPFSIKRLIRWGGQFDLSACGIERNGNEFDYTRMNFGLNPIHPEIVFQHDHEDRGDNGYTWFYINEPLKVTVDMSEETSQLRPILDRYPQEAEFFLNAGIDVEGELMPIRHFTYDENTDTWDQDGEISFTDSELILDGEAPGLDLSSWSEEQIVDLLDSLHQQDRGDIQLRAGIKCADVVVAEEWFNVEIRWPNRRLALPDTLTGEIFAHEDNRTWLYLEDSEHSGSNGNEEAGTWYEVGVEKIELDESEDPTKFEVRSPEDTESGCWEVCGLEPGEYLLHYTLTGYPENSAAPYSIDWVWVVSDTMYGIAIKDTDGKLLYDWEQFPVFPDETRTYYPVLRKYTTDNPDGEDVTSVEADENISAVRFEVWKEGSAAGQLVDGTVEAFNADWSKGIQVVARTRGSFRILPVAYVTLAESGDEIYVENNAGWFNIEVQTAYATLDLSEGQLSVVPGQTVLPEELEEMAAGKFTRYTMNDPDGTVMDPDRLWFDDSDPSDIILLDIDQDGCASEMKVAENALDRLPAGEKVLEVSVHVGSASEDGVYGGSWLKVLIHGHNAETLVKTEAKAATCEAAGNIAYWTCSECGKIFSDAEGKTEITGADTVIAATGHVNLVKTEAKAATCEAAGNTEYWTCSACGKIFSDAEGKTEITAADTVIAATGHVNLVKTEAKAATCEAAGNTEYWTCSACGKIFSDAEGKTEITAADTVIAATGHVLVHVAAKDATCKEPGNKEYWRCSKCGKFFSDAEGKTEITEEETVVPKHQNHTWDAGKVTKAATVTAEGVKTFTCTVCGETKTEPIAKLPNPEGDPKDPTSIAAAEKVVTAISENGEPAGSSFAKLQLQSKKQSKNSITLTWNKVSGAAGYILYGAQRGNANKMKRITKITNGATKSYTYKGLKADTYYKFVLVAYAKSGSAEKQVATSKVTYAATTSKKVTNVSKVTVKAKKVTLKKGKTATIKGTQVLKNKKLKLTKCRKLRFEVDKSAIASVSKSGKIKAKKPGSCTIYVFSQNGTFVKVKVKVTK